MYKCSEMVNSCGACLTLPSEKFNCGWCKSTSSCEEAEHCTEHNDWMDISSYSSQACPNIKTIEPIIDDVKNETIRIIEDVDSSK